VLKKQPFNRKTTALYRWVFPEVWIFGTIRKALYFTHFGKRYESLSPANLRPA